MHRGGSVRIWEFVTRFTRFSLEIRKTILFSFWSILKEILEANKQEGTEGSISRTIGVATTGTPVDTLRAFWLSFVGSCSRINPIVKYGV